MPRFEYKISFSKWEIEINRALISYTGPQGRKKEIHQNQITGIGIGLATGPGSTINKDLNGKDIREISSIMNWIIIAYKKDFDSKKSKVIKIPFKTTDSQQIEIADSLISAYKNKYIGAGAYREVEKALGKSQTAAIIIALAIFSLSVGLAAFGAFMEANAF